MNEAEVPTSEAPVDGARHRVVIVGGGIAGLALATKLGTAFRRSKRAEVVLVDKGAAHVWKPMLHTFAAGTVHPYQQKVSFLAHADRNGFRYVPGTLGGIAPGARTITLAPLCAADGGVILDERRLSYDTLVLAAGSRANDFGTEGVAASCLFIDDLDGAEAFNRRFYESLLRAIEYGETLRIAIVGGGATGVELAAEVSQLLGVIARYGAGPPPRLELTLIESGPRILAAFPEAVATAADHQLRALGMKVVTHARVVAADAEGFTLADGSRIDAALRVWAAGVKAPPAFAALADFERTRTGQVLVRPTLQTTTDDRVFALGDCASLVPPGAAAPLPATAQVARQQAAHLGRNLPGWLDGGALAPFAFRDLGALVSLSRYNAFGTLARRGLFSGGFIQGRFAQLSHAMLYRLHQVELHGLRRAALLWLSGAIAATVRPSIRID